MFKQLIFGFVIFIAGSRSVLPAVLDRYHPVFSADQVKVDSTSSGFSPKQMSELSGICFTAFRIMLDQTTTSKQNNNSPDEEETPEYTIPPDFQQIGERFFYIERYEYLSWIEAKNTCRQMGGVLATIQDEEELAAISQSLQYDSYWLENEFYNNGNGKQFFALQEEEGEEKLCVHLYQFYMFRENCENKNLFICEAVEYSF